MGDEQCCVLLSLLFGIPPLAKVRQREHVADVGYDC
jgi:hypothetical protein